MDIYYIDNNGTQNIVELKFKKDDKSLLENLLVEGIDQVCS